MTNLELFFIDYSFLNDRRKRRRMDSHIQGRGLDLYGSRNSNDPTCNRSLLSESLRNMNSSDLVSY